MTNSSNTSTTPLRILFISRAYPPIVGGIENQNYELSQWLPTITSTHTIANTRGKKFLPFFFVRLFFTVPFLIKKYDVILLGDGVLGVIAWWIKRCDRTKKVVCITHGLDLTYHNAIYQRLWVRTFIPCCDRLIAVGNQTIAEGVLRGIARDMFTFIPNGVDPKKFIYDDISPDAIYDIIGSQHKDKKILLTFGRLARRKGVAWFIRNVLPQLRDDIIYIVAGTGPDLDNVMRAIRETKTSDRVMMMGLVDDTTRAKIFAAADIFVQPNITVAGDMEGFGISVIEAGISGVPVLAARLEGLKDAIHDGKNGILLPSEDPDAWRNAITAVLDDDAKRKDIGISARTYITQHFSWSKIAQKYYDILRSL
jgi:phosphatidylinositol alpha-1,6-mannosyltransferase